MRGGDWKVSYYPEEATGPRIVRGILLALFVIFFVALFGGAYLIAQDRMKESQPRTPTEPPAQTAKEIGASMYELGRQSVLAEQELAKLRAKAAELKAQADEMESVVKFVKCVERESGRKFESLAESEKYNDKCRAEALGKPL